jgi:DNA polymerase-3 subunit epsilon
VKVTRPAIPFARAIDTIDIAKAKFPGSRYSLDELCKRFSIDLATRTKHGALLDASLLAQVYLELIGGRQTKLMLAPTDTAIVVGEASQQPARVRLAPLAPRITQAELEAHARFVADLGPEAIWNQA